MQIILEENRAHIWVIESPALMRHYLGGLIRQVDSQDGPYVLSENGKELEISKYLDIVLNPFEIDLNDRKCINKVYMELKELAFDERYYLQTQQLFSAIERYLMELEQDMCVDLHHEGLDMTYFFKAAGIKIEDDESDLISCLGQYLHVISKLLNKKVVIFVNLSSYLEKAEMIALLEQAFYLKIFLIFLEKEEICLDILSKCYIIDVDGCEIF